MSIRRASQVRCAIGDEEASIEEARREWYICTQCGCYVCPRCYEMFRRSGQQVCPGTLSRGAEEHQPHFTRFLPHQAETRGLPPQPAQQLQTHPTRPSVVILGDVTGDREQSRKRGRVIILGDVEREEGMEGDEENGS